jgi:peptide deformylase
LRVVPDSYSYITNMDDQLLQQIRDIIKSPRSPLVLAPNPILQAECQPVEWSEDIDNVLDFMVAVMNAHHGIGLAAPQIGLPIQLIVAQTDKGIITAINPVLKSSSDEIVWYKEGCLSYPDYFVSLPRPESVTIALEGDNPDMPMETELSGIGARVIQHEMDHLTGICLAEKILELPKNKQRIAKDKLAKHFKKRK